MTSTIEPGTAVTAQPGSASPAEAPLTPAAGAELLGDVHGSGYADGAALVRRGDGQMVQLGPLQYAVLEAADGHRSNAEIAAAVSERLGRRLDERHVDRIAAKLSTQGLLAGSEAAAPPRRNPLLALRWKVLVTNPRVTRWLTAPFTVLFRPWIMWPVLAAFVGVCWFVLFHKGLAAPGAEAFRRPGLLLLLFGIGIVSAGFHELGHAAACRYSGATPGGMGVGVYLVWPAFYTDVTDAYRLDRRSRLRVDLAGLYFNAIIAVAITAIWLGTKVDALLLAVALQLVLMVKQLSPVIRADGYHILADATGVPDLFAHIGPTLKRLVPGTKRSPSALTGKARLLVTLWVLVVVPVLLSLMAAAILLLPRLATSAWNSGRSIAEAIPHTAGRGDVLGVGADVLRLIALVLPVVGSALIAQRVVRMLVTKARMWSAGHLGRRAAALLAGAGVLALAAWAWWPGGQYQPVRSNERGTLPSLVSMLSAPSAMARPIPSGLVAPGRYLALAMVPKGQPSAEHPAVLFVPDAHGQPIAMLSTTSPRTPTDAVSARPTMAPTAATQPSGAPNPTASVTASPSGAGAVTAAPATGFPSASPATAFPFTLPAAPRSGDTQALATNQTDGGVVYKVAYAVVTVSGDSAVTNDNSAFALASCKACTTVAVAFQVVLVVGETHAIAPINAAEAVNVDCPACMTTAIADQLVVTLTALPPHDVQARLTAALRRLNLIKLLGADATPDQVTTQVGAVQQQVESILQDSGLLEQPLPTASPASASTPTATSVPSQRTSPTQSPLPAGQPTPEDATTPMDSPSHTATPSASGSGTPSATDTPIATSS